MTSPENTTARDPFVHLIGAMSDGTDRYITDMEAAEVVEAGDVERVARALAADWVTRYPDDNEPWEHLTDGAQASFRRDARIAIAAMSR